MVTDKLVRVINSHQEGIIPRQIVMHNLQEVMQTPVPVPVLIIAADQADILQDTPILMEERNPITEEQADQVPVHQVIIHPLPLPLIVPEDHQEVVVEVQVEGTHHLLEAVAVVTLREVAVAEADIRVAEVTDKKIHLILIHKI